VTVDQLIGPRQDHIQINVWVTSSIASTDRTHTCNYPDQNFVTSQISSFFRQKKICSSSQEITTVGARTFMKFDHEKHWNNQIFAQDLIEPISSRPQTGHCTDWAFLCNVCN
jgi:hypothetical protein